MPLTVAVYLVHWNSPEWCAESVASLRASTGVDLSLTVVDNGQVDGPALRDLLPDDVRVLETGANLGYTGAANLAVDDWLDHPSAADLCAIGSHDLHVEPHCLATVVQALHDEPDIAIAGPAIVRSPASYGGTWNGARSRRLAALQPGEDTRAVVERDWVAGTCMVVTREFAAAHRPVFDTRLGSYHDDVDACLRAGALSWRVVLVPSAHAWGIGSESRDVSFWTDRNSVIVAAKYGRADQLTRAIGAVIVRAARTAIASVLPGRSRAARTESRRYLAQHTRALREVWARRGMLRSIRRERYRQPASNR